MKEFIVGSVIFLLLMFFPLQWMMNQINHYKIQSVNNIVHVAAQKARIEGSFKQENIDEMKAKIADALSIDESDIHINVTKTPKYRFDQFQVDEMIEYEIGIPIKQVIAMHHFFGIDENANQFEYIVKGAVASELLAP